MPPVETGKESHLVVWSIREQAAVIDWRAQTTLKQSRKSTLTNTLQALKCFVARASSYLSTTPTLGACSAVPPRAEGNHLNLACFAGRGFGWCVSERPRNLARNLGVLLRMCVVCFHTPNFLFDVPARQTCQVKVIGAASSRVLFFFICRCKCAQNPCAILKGTP